MGNLAGCDLVDGLACAKDYNCLHQHRCTLDGMHHICNLPRLAASAAAAAMLTMSATDSSASFVEMVNVCR